MVRKKAPVRMRTTVRSTAAHAGIQPKEYTVTLYEGSTDPWCTCPAHRFKPDMRPCKHIRSVLAADSNSTLATHGTGDEFFVPASVAGHDEDFLLVLEHVVSPPANGSSFAHPLDVIAEVGKAGDGAKALRMLNDLWEEQAQDWPAKYRNEIAEILEESA